MQVQRLVIPCMLAFNAIAYNYVCMYVIVIFIQLPEGVNISKEARTAIGKAASVFILYSTAWYVHNCSSFPCKTNIFLFWQFSANNFALKSKRKTLNAADVFSALEDMEFEHFAPELKNFLDGNNFSMMHNYMRIHTHPHFYLSNVCMHPIDTLVDLMHIQRTTIMTLTLVMLPSHLVQCIKWSRKEEKKQLPIARRSNRLLPQPW